MMPDLGVLLEHWGYLAIFLVVILGNVGLPVPEETILALAGYLVWRGQLRLVLVVAVGILSAAVGDNLGYWFGRRYGRGAIERYGQRALLPPERMEKVWRFVSRYGPRAVFAAMIRAVFKRLDNVATRVYTNCLSVGGCCQKARQVKRRFAGSRRIADGPNG